MKQRIQGEPLGRLAVRQGKWVGSRTALALDVSFGPRQRGALGVLVYHRLTEEVDGAPSPTLNVSPEAFDLQMRGLLEEGFTIWRLRDALNHSREGLSFPPRSAVITFDDGYHNVYRNAWPILKSLNIPATIFIVTGHIGRKEPFPFDAWANLHHDSAASEAWSPLRWEECSEMEDSGLVDIGSHSHSHADFRGNPDDFADDLRKSLAMLNQRLAPLDRPFAFPFGSISRGFASPLLQARARDVGVTCALTTEIGLVSPGMSPYAWPRLEVDSSDISASIRAKVDGWYSWMNGARHAFWRGRKLLRSLSETVPSRAAR